MQKMDHYLLSCDWFGSNVSQAHCFLRMNSNKVALKRAKITQIDWIASKAPFAWLWISGAQLVVSNENEDEYEQKKQKNSTLETKLKHRLCLPLGLRTEFTIMQLALENVDTRNG